MLLEESGLTKKDKKKRHKSSDSDRLKQFSVLFWFWKCFWREIKKRKKEETYENSCKHKKEKKQKESKKTASSESEAENLESQPQSTVYPEEIPSVPENRFLMRRKFS